MLTAKKTDKERGQALVILAVALLALIAFAGLAIDGGRFYAERRQTQNAADAVALAGARELAEFISTCASADIANDNGKSLSRPGAGRGLADSGGETQATYYHIVGLTAVELVAVDTKGNDKSITGIFQNVVIGEGLIDPGAGIGSTGKGTCRFPMLIGVKLWE